MEGRTTFIIAQKLSAIRDADQILVFDRGRIVHRGTHDDLLHQPGFYRELAEAQGQEAAAAVTGERQPA
jgi:ABC-type multidrug transport system fused ATPase/permease subunit